MQSCIGWISGLIRQQVPGAFIRSAAVLLRPCWFFIIVYYEHLEDLGLDIRSSGRSIGTVPYLSNNSSIKLQSMTNDKHYIYYVRLPQPPPYLRQARGRNRTCTALCCYGQSCMGRKPPSNEAGGSVEARLPRTRSTISRYGMGRTKGCFPT